MILENDSPKELTFTYDYHKNCDGEDIQKGFIRHWFK